MPRIFIVDDSISVRKALEITFNRHSLDSLSAVSGEQALEILQSGETKFDLIMADVIMPGLSGIELCQSLRQQSEFAAIPIVLMSGNVDDELKHRAREVGANGVLRKPFSPDELIPMVEHLLRNPPAAPTQSTPTPVTAAPAPVEPAISSHSEPAPTLPPAAPAAPATDPLQQVKNYTRAYLSQPGMLDVAVLDPQFRTIYRSAQVMPPNLLAYARHFIQTAATLGQQEMQDTLDVISLKFHGKTLTLHHLDGHTIVSLRHPPAKA